MFTGIVEEMGTVDRIEREAGRARLWIGCETVLEGTRLGESIAVSGCCLTVDELDDAQGAWAADLMTATLRDTALGDLAAGDRVNLERAVASGGRLGGHLVQGHVDGVGTVVDRDEQPGMVSLTVAVPPEHARYVVPKGSITVDGVSLTVTDVEEGEGGPRFRVGLIPHTLEATTLAERAPRDRVNLEVDVIAKYVERLLAAGAETPYGTDAGVREPA